MRFNEANEPIDPDIKLSGMRDKPQKGRERVTLSNAFSSLVDFITTNGLVKSGRGERVGAMQYIYDAITGKDQNKLIKILEEHEPALARYILDARNLVSKVQVDTDVLEQLAKIQVDPRRVLSLFASAFAGAGNTEAFRELMKMVSQFTYSAEYQQEVLDAFHKFAIEKNKMTIAAAIEQFLGKHGQANLSDEDIKSLQQLLARVPPEQSRKVITKWLNQHPETQQAIHSLLGEPAENSDIDPLDLFAKIVSTIMEIKKDAAKNPMQMTRRSFFGNLGAAVVGGAALMLPISHIIRKASEAQTAEQALQIAREEAKKEAFLQSHEVNVRIDKQTSANFKMEPAGDSFNVVVTAGGKTGVPNQAAIHNQIERMIATTGLVVGKSQTGPPQGNEITITFPVKDMSKFRGFRSLMDNQFKESNIGFRDWVFFNP